MMRKLSALVLLVSLVAACDSDGDPKAEETATATVTASPTPTATPTPTPTPTPTKAPTVAPKPTKTIKPAPILSACDKIWKAGATLPATYNGCPEAPGESSWEVEECVDDTKEATYWSADGSRFVALLGGTIYKRNPNLDGNYEATLEKCSGEG